MRNSDFYYTLIAENRGKIQRVYFALVCVILLYRFFEGLMISQIGESPILYQEIDIVYWLFMLTNIPDFITGYMAIVFDSLLFITAFLSAIFPRQILTPILFSFCYFIYFVLYNMNAGHHYINVGILFISFSFTQKNAKVVAYCWAFMRFVFMFIMTSAGIWKIARGNLFYPDQLTMIIIPRKIKLLTLATESIQYKTVKWIVANPTVSQITWDLLILMEIIFVIGFFTLKKDNLLLIVYLLFFVGGLFLTGIFVIENLLFLLTLLPVTKAIIVVSQKFVKTKKIRSRQRFS